MRRDSPILKFLLPAFAATVLTAVVYAILKLDQFESAYIKVILMDRHPIQWATMFLSFWTASMLFWKFFSIGKEARWADVSPLEEGTRVITRFEAQQHIDQIRTRSDNLSKSILGKRIIGALTNFRAHGKVQEVVDMLSAQSDLEANKTDNSYTLIKVFVASIPILGFIGTVIGIGSAVGGFESQLNSVEDISEIKNSLGAITGGLSTAFDTTLVALVMSIILMIPLGSIQQFEEKNLNEMDDYLTGVFLNLLKEESDAVDSSTGALGEVKDLMAEALKAMWQQTEKNHDLLKEHFTGIVDSIGGNNDLQDRASYKNEFETLIGQIRSLQREQAESITLMSEASTRHASEIRKTFEENLLDLNTWGKSFRDGLKETQSSFIQSQDKLSGQLDASSRLILTESEKVSEAYRNMAEGFVTELTNFYKDSIEQTRQQISEHSEQEQKRLGVMMSEQGEVSTKYINILRETRQSFAEMSVGWQEKESELLDHFDKKAQENMKLMSNHFVELLEKQSSVSSNINNLLNETSRQTQICQDLLPALGDKAASELTQTRVDMEREFGTVSKAMTDVVVQMHEQSQNQTNMLSEFARTQNQANQSVEKLAVRLGEAVEHVQKINRKDYDADGNPRKWWKVWGD